MPGGDGTGPLGTGPRWGRCVGAGFRRGMGCGAGRGAGYGMIYPADPVSEKQVLLNRASVLEQELAAIRSRLGTEETPAS